MKNELIELWSLCSKFQVYTTRGYAWSPAKYDADIRQRCYTARCKKNISCRFWCWNSSIMFKSFQLFPLFSVKSHQIIQHHFISSNPEKPLVPHPTWPSTSSTIHLGFPHHPDLQFLLQAQLFLADAIVLVLQHAQLQRQLLHFPRGVIRPGAPLPESWGWGGLVSGSSDLQIEKQQLRIISCICIYIYIHIYI